MVNRNYPAEIEAAAEVFVGATDPRLGERPFATLWADTSTDPATLKYYNESINPPVWVVVTGGSTGDYLPLAGGALTGPLTVAGKVTQTVTTNGSNGFFLGDTYHGMTFNGSNTLQFIEYHDRWEWRHRNGSVDNLKMSLYGGALGPSTAYDVTYQTSWTGTMDFRVNPAMVTLRMSGVTYNDGVGANARIKICSLPSGVPAPWGTLRTPARFRMNWAGDNSQCWIEIASDGVWVQAGTSGPGGGWSLDATITYAR